MKYRDTQEKFYDIRSTLDKDYLPEIDEEYLGLVLGINIDGRTKFRQGSREWVYDVRHGAGRVFPQKTKAGGGDRTVYFISKVTGLKIYDVLTRYYRWKHNYKTTEQIVNDYLKENPSLVGFEVVPETTAVVKTNVKEIVKYTANDFTKEDMEIFNDFEGKNVVNPLDWMPEKLDTGRGWFINESYFKLKDGTYVGDRTGPVPYKTDEGGWTVLHSELDHPTLLRIAAAKDWLVERGMHKAINRPKKGWRYDYREGCIEYEGIYTLSGSAKKDRVRNAMPTKVAQLKRYMNPRYVDGKPQLKKFVKGSQSIPYLLENVKLRDKVLVVCEGVPDACFVQNGVAINSWKPSDLSTAIIETMQKEHKMRVIYITDNWRNGDKGGQMMLDWAKANAPDLEILDWKYLGDTKAKDIGEYVKERVDAGDKSFITDDGEYQMPRELILLAARKASEIHAKDMWDFDEIIPA